MLWKRFWEDELGVQVAMETVMVGTVGVLALTGGVAALADAVNDELCEVAMAVRGFDQSYAVSGFQTSGTVRTGLGMSCNGVSSASFSAFKAGSGFQQAPVDTTVITHLHCAAPNVLRDCDLGGRPTTDVTPQTEVLVDEPPSVVRERVESARPQSVPPRRPDVDRNPPRNRRDTPVDQEQPRDGKTEAELEPERVSPPASARTY